MEHILQDPLSLNYISIYNSSKVSCQIDTYFKGLLLIFINIHSLTNSLQFINHKETYGVRKTIEVFYKYTDIFISN